MKQRKLYLIIGFLFVVIIFCSHCGNKNDRNSVYPLVKKIGEKSFKVDLIYTDNFSNLDNWVVESTGSVEVLNNELIWDCHQVKEAYGTIWCKKFFQGPTIIMYDVVTISGMDNINFIFYATKEPEGLLETTSERTGEYVEYHKFPNYIITYLTAYKPQWRIRFRKNPGFNLISEKFIDRSTEQGVKQHITYVFEEDGTMSLYSDGNLLHTYKDEESSFRSGYHGLRTYHSTLRYSNFRVYAILKKGET
jgi:uncharacterized protein YkvS